MTAKTTSGVAESAAETSDTMTSAAATTTTTTTSATEATAATAATENGPPKKQLSRQEFAAQMRAHRLNAAQDRMKYIYGITSSVPQPGSTPSGAPRPLAQAREREPETNNNNGADPMMDGDADILNTADAASAPRSKFAHASSFGATKSTTTTKPTKTAAAADDFAGASSQWQASGSFAGTINSNTNKNSINDNLNHSIQQLLGVQKGSGSDRSSARAQQRVARMQAAMVAATKAEQMWRVAHLVATLVFAGYMFIAMYGRVKMRYVFADSVLAGALEVGGLGDHDLPQQNVFGILMGLEFVMVTARYLAMRKHSKSRAMINLGTMAAHKGLPPGMAALAGEVSNTIQGPVDVFAHVYHGFLHVLFVFGCSVLVCWIMAFQWPQVIKSSTTSGSYDDGF